MFVLGEPIRSLLIKTIDRMIMYRPGKDFVDITEMTLIKRDVDPEDINWVSVKDIDPDFIEELREGLRELRNVQWRLDEEIKDTVRDLKDIEDAIFDDFEDWLRHPDALYADVMLPEFVKI